jgi:hypothetical protein
MPETQEETMGEREQADEARVPSEPTEQARRLAQFFHETYERLAPEFGYETRTESAVPWEQVPENNRALMEAVAAEVLADHLAALSKAEKELDAEIGKHHAAEVRAFQAEKERHELRERFDRLDTAAGEASEEIARALVVMDRDSQAAHILDAVLALLDETLSRLFHGDELVDAAQRAAALTTNKAEGEGAT